MSERAHPGQVAGSAWNPEQYAKFADARLRPARELLDRIGPEAPEVIYDLGCGSGEITRMIADRWPLASVFGIDNSPDMLEKAAREPGGVHWAEGDIRTWKPDLPPDLIYANASLQWVENHEALFPRLARYLRQGGVLAVQMPLSWHAPTHRLMRETLAEGGPGRSSIGPKELRESLATPWVAEATEYFDLLEPHAESLDIWETEYLQQLRGEDAVLEWVKGTGLRPILAALGDTERENFLAEYRTRLRDAYPTRPNGDTLYLFRRLFTVAHR